jgi:predicted XRE-type DNA-binding protein
MIAAIARIRPFQVGTSGAHKVEKSSGNVFADLLRPDAAELDTKVRLAVEITRLIGARKLSQTAAGALLEINQPKVSALKHYKLDVFSVERLMTFLLALGQDIEIRIKPRAHRVSDVLAGTSGTGAKAWGGRRGGSQRTSGSSGNDAAR